MSEQKNTKKNAKSRQEWLDEKGIYMAFSEEAANRLAWIISGAIAVLTLPFVILAIMA